MPTPSPSVETTAQLRERARTAQQRLDWAEAAQLFEAAADNYPARFAGALQAADINALRRSASTCRSMLGNSAS